MLLVKDILKTYNVSTLYGNFQYEIVQNIHANLFSNKQFNSIYKIVQDFFFTVNNIIISQFIILTKMKCRRY